MRVDKYDDGVKTTREAWWKHPGVILFYIIGSPLLSLVLNRFGFKNWIERGIQVPENNSQEVNNLPNILGTAGSILTGFVILLILPIISRWIWQLIAPIYKYTKNAFKKAIKSLRKQLKSRGYYA